MATRDWDVKVKKFERDVVVVDTLILKFVSEKLGSRQCIRKLAGSRCARIEAASGARLELEAHDDFAWEARVYSTRDKQVNMVQFAGGIIICL